MTLSLGHVNRSCLLTYNHVQPAHHFTAPFRIIQGAPPFRDDWKSRVTASDDRNRIQYNNTAKTQHIGFIQQNEKYSKKITKKYSNYLLIHTKKLFGYKTRLRCTRLHGLFIQGGSKIEATYWLLTSVKNPKPNVVIPVNSIKLASYVFLVIAKITQISQGFSKLGDTLYKRARSFCTMQSK